MKRIFEIALVTSHLFLLYTPGFGKAATQETPAKELTKIQLNKSTSLCGIPTLVAYENGYFAEEGYDVELITADSETRKLGLNNGTLPLANWDYAYFPSIENGLGIVVVDGLHRGCITIIVPENSSIKNVQDLRGKKIAIEELGGTEAQVAIVWLETNGIKAAANEEAELIPYGDGNLEIAAALKGEVDAAAIWDPIGAIAVKTQGFRKIFDLNETEPFAGRYCCFLMASTKILNENPEEIAALLRAFHKAQNWINDNPEAAAKLVIEKQYINVDDLDLAVSLIKNYNYPTYKDRADGTTNVYEDVLYFSQKLIDLGFLKAPDAKIVADKIYKEVATNDY
jgi:NitT/TauT family transport system substrate-binding protein